MHEGSLVCSCTKPLNTEMTRTFRYILAPLLWSGEEVCVSVFGEIQMSSSGWNVKFQSSSGNDLRGGMKDRLIMQWWLTLVSCLFFIKKCAENTDGKSRFWNVLVFQEWVKRFVFVFSDFPSVLGQIYSINRPWASLSCAERTERMKH